jgi:hypothetical protein
MILVKLTIQWHGDEIITTPCLMSVRENGKSFSAVNGEKIFHYLSSKNDIYKGYSTNGWTIIDVERIVDTAQENRYGNRN